MSPSPPWTAWAGVSGEVWKGSGTCREPASAPCLLSMLIHSYHNVLEPAHGNQDGSVSAQPPALPSGRHATEKIKPTEPQNSIIRTCNGGIEPLKSHQNGVRTGWSHHLRDADFLPRHTQSGRVA